MKKQLSICLYVTTELKALKPYSRERHLRRIKNLLSEFPDDIVYIVCRENDHSRISGIVSGANHTISHFSLRTFQTGEVPRSFFILQDTNPCITREILEYWDAKLAFLHGRKIIDVAYPFQVSLIKGDFRIYSSDLVKSLIKKRLPVESWFDYPNSPGLTLITRESVGYNPAHLSETYKRYMEDTKFPECFLIEPTTHCNFKCSMCPYHSDRYSDPPVAPYIPESRFHHMDLGLYKRLIDEITSYDVVSLVPQYRGEPFMHPKFLDMLQYARKKGMDNICFPTNGYWLDDKMIDGILDADLAGLIFSFDGLTKETYTAIRHNSDFNRVRKNIFKLRDRRDRRNLKRPFIQMTFVELPENMHEREDYIKFWMNEVDRVKINIGLSYKELRTRQPFGFSLHNYEQRPPCPLVLSNAAVTAEGKMVLCHTDSTESTVLADLNRSTVKDGYDSKRRRKTAKEHLSNDLPSGHICENCQIWRADHYVNFDDPEYKVYGGTWWINYERKMAKSE